MERQLAVVEAGVVVNLLVVDPNDVATIEFFGGLLLPDNSQVAIGWHYDGVSFTEPVVVRTLGQAISEKIEAINAACAAAIIGGFDSSALGDSHRYDSAETDQLNLIGAVSMGVSVPYTCTDIAGIKAMRLHSAGQLKQVLADGAAIKMAALAKARTLKDISASAADVAAVDAVVW